MVIHYADESAFYNGVLECVKRGLTFRAHHDRLTIILEGGY